MSLVIFYLLLCIIPETGIKFSWGLLILLWVVYFILSAILGIISALVKTK